jgi:hypothetical protein
MKITEKFVNAQTGEETIIERDETAQETKSRLAIEAKNKQDATEKAAKAAEKSALLDRLGITNEEAQLLLS